MLVASSTNHMGKPMPSTAVKVQRGRMKNLIRTVLEHESDAKERGSRYWAAAEVPSPIWFVVECCVEVSGRGEVQRWVTTSVHHAASIERGFMPKLWSHIIVCMRAPLSLRNASVFEVLKEA